MMKIKGVRTVEDLKREVAPDPEIKHLRSQVDRLTKLIDGLEKDDGLLISLFEAMNSEIRRAEPQPQIWTPTDHGLAMTLVEHITDVHYGAVQDADEIEGFGRYSPEISRERILRFGSKILDWTATLRKSYDIDELVAIVTGDLISGDIQRLEVTNEFPSPVQAVKVAYLLSDMFQMQAQHFKKLRIEFVCADNHGRLTQKPQSREAGQNTYNYVIGHLIKEILRDQKNIGINIYPMVQKVIEVMGYRYLICHGNGIKGWAGIPYYGIDRKTAKESVRRMNADDSLKFDKIIMGHFHAPLNAPLFQIGGSVSGTEAYDHSEGRHSEPIQTAWLVHPKYGETDWSRFYLTR